MCIRDRSAAADLGGSTSGPLHSDDEDGEENPGAKAAAPISQVSGDPQQRAGDTPDPRPSVGAEVAYGTKMGSAVTYPIKPSMEEVDMSADVAALLEGTELSEEFAEKAKTILRLLSKRKSLKSMTDL